MAKAPRPNPLEMVTAKLPPPPSSSSGTPAPAAERRGAIPIVKAMERQEESAIERVRELEGQVEAIRRDGREIVQLDAAEVQPSRWRDRDERYSHDEAMDELVESIRRDGQLVPILVRPLPEEPAKHEAVFGHRRLFACRHLGIPVRAVVRDVPDAVMAVAAYAENAKRQSVSVLEQALWFERLLEAKIYPDQRTLAKALGVHEGTVSKLLSLRVIPQEALDALGDWRRCSQRDAEALRDRARDEAGRAAMLAACKELGEAGNRTGFSTRLAILLGRDAAETGDEHDRLTDSRGRLIAAFRRGKRAPSFAFNRDADPEFARFVWDKLPSLLREFEQANGRARRR